MRILSHWLLQINLLPLNIFFFEALLNVMIRGVVVVVIFCRCQNALSNLVVRQAIFNRNGTAFLNWLLRFLYVINVVLRLIHTVIFCEIFQNLMLILICSHVCHVILITIFRLHVCIDRVLGVLCGVMRLQNWAKNAHMLLSRAKIGSTFWRDQRRIVMGYILDRSCAASNHWISKCVLILLVGGRHHRHILLLYCNWMRIFGRRINSRPQSPIKFGCQNAWSSRSCIKTWLIDVCGYRRWWHLNKIHEVFLERI